jgi:hypothetical protein
MKLKKTELWRKGRKVGEFFPEKEERYKGVYYFSGPLGGHFIFVKNFRKDLMYFFVFRDPTIEELNDSKIERQEFIIYYE